MNDRKFYQHKSIRYLSNMLDIYVTAIISPVEFKKKNKAENSIIKSNPPIAYAGKEKKRNNHLVIYLFFIS